MRIIICGLWSRKDDQNYDVEYFTFFSQLTIAEHTFEIYNEFRP